MAYTTAQARKLAEQIHSRFGSLIASACNGTPVPPEFVAGLIGVEAGRDRQGRINENATRFERGVFNKLQRVRDGALKSWSGIKPSDIKDASDLALKNLATSFGVCQVMGWHTINNLDCTIGELRDPNKHIGCAVQLLLLNSQDGDFERREYVGEFREWNTGSEKGKTYHADYVANAGAVMDAYRELGLVTESVTEDKGTTTGDKPPEETAGTPPPAPAMEVKASGVSLATRLTSLSVPAGVVSAIGGIIAFAKELPPYAWIAFSAIVIAGMWIGYLIWREAKREAHERTKIVLDAAADRDKNNLRLV